MSKFPGRIVSNLAPAGYSVYFDGTGDYLTVASNAALGFGTGDFTVEFWINLPSASTTQVLFDNRNLGTGIVIFSNSGTLTVNFNNSGGTLITGGALTSNTWTHIALSRASGSSRLYINGTQSGSTASDANNYPTNATYIGSNFSAGQTITGYVSNLRILKGTGLYTAAFTPPTQLFNITNTSLLTCNSPAIVDQSTNNFTITANGNAAVSTLTPFTAYVPYNPALGASTPGIWTLDEALQAAATRQWNMYDPNFNLTTLLLHGNGTNGAQNNTFLDSSSNNFTITRNGNTTQGTFSPFSQTGWSNYFGGSQSINAAASADFQFAGDFTIEGWVYTTSTSDSSLVVQQSGSNYLALNVQGGTGFNIYLNSASPTISPTDRVPVLNTWNHVALVRSGTGSGNVKIYLNGIASSTTATNTSTLGYNALFYVGAIGTNSSGSFVGYISNVRVVNGTALYTTNFTPSATPLTAVANTKLLTCQSNRFIDANTQVTAKTITVSGTPSVQAFSPFYPTAAYTPQTIGGSGFFDGTGDFLSVAQNAAFSLGTGAFSVEAFFYLTSFSLTNRIIGLGDGAYGIAPLTYTGWTLNVSSTQVQWYRFDGAETTYNATTTVNLNSWNHVVVCRDSSSNLAIFLNGNRILNQASVTTSYNNVNTNPLYLGRAEDGAGGGSISTKFINGYVSNARVVKGSSVYDPTQTTLTVPTAPPTAITNTSLLLNFTNAGVVDSTGKNVLETVGNAQISTAFSRFGGSSMFFDGNGDYLIMPNVLTGQFGTGDFTVEYWDRHGSQSTNFAPQVGTLSVATPSGTWRFGTFTNSGGVYLAYHNGTSFIDVQFGSVLYNDNIWRHFALTRQNGIVRAFVDGVQVGTNQTITQNFNSANRVVVGAELQNPTYFNGYIDDLRITTGFARYTGNFTPQTSQWQDQ